jgi:hypothetical protein
MDTRGSMHNRDMEANARDRAGLGREDTASAR